MDNPLAIKKGQILWHLSFISTQRPPVSQPTVRRVRQWTALRGSIAVFRLYRDGTEASMPVSIDTLKVSVMKMRSLFRT
jgi:hypothetical protein